MMKKIFFLLLIPVLIISCRKAVEVTVPDTGLVSSSVYAQNSTAEAAVTAIYSLMAQGTVSDGERSINYEMGLSADELMTFSSDITLSQFYSNSLLSDNYYFWRDTYQTIYLANSAIEGLTASNTLSSIIKQQLLGEAKFVRAFQYFYLVNLYGKVPLALTTDYRINNILKRASEQDVYSQMISDLKDAQNLLSDNYKLSNGGNAMERVRPNKGTATALLARVYLYQSDWANAEQQATLLINSPIYTLEPNLNDTFLIPSREVIWQLQTVIPGINTRDGRAFILTGIPGSGNASGELNSNLVNVFEPGDKRFNNWVGVYQDTLTTPKTNYYYPLKYKQNEDATITEYQTVFRLAEQYLIRAEAKIQLNNIADGISDLNILRKRARAEKTVKVDDPLPALSTILSKADALTAVLHERQVELFTEWGHRWFDLRRTGKLNEVMTSLNTVKGRIWSPDAQLLPIPRGEIIVNHNLIQNKGYN